jgi:hypothetical protein
VANKASMLAQSHTMHNFWIFGLNFDRYLFFYSPFKKIPLVNKFSSLS